MKKTVFILFLIFAAAAAAFFAGRISIPAGSTGVIHSGVSGLLGPFDQNRFQWVWQRLIPGDTRLHLLPAGRFSVARSCRIDLPGLDDIPAGTPVAGHIQLQLELQLKLPRSNALPLLQKGITNAEEFSSGQLRRIAERLRSMLIKLIETDIRNNRTSRIVQLVDAQLKPQLQQAAAAAFQDHPLRLLGSSCTLQKVPDMIRYRQLRTALAADVNTLTRVINLRRRQAAEQAALLEKRKAQRSHWQQVGKLLDSYPKLLNFFTIDKLAPNVRVTVVQGGISALMDYTNSKRDGVAGTIQRRTPQQNTTNR